MKRILFQPFDIGKWFVLGFTAWLATLLDQGGSSSGNGGSGDSGSAGDSDIRELYQEGSQWVQDNLQIVVTIGSIVTVLFLAIWILLLWLSSRGKFIFLDNVVHNRALVKAPWAQFKKQGNSLFWWRLGFSIIMVFIVLGLFGVGAAALFPVLQGSEPDPVVFVPLIIGFAMVFFALIAVALYII
ncbi:MAG: hypothetical protein AAF585_10660, partial [Verrucomicrobiota bacterium]